MEAGEYLFFLAIQRLTGEREALLPKAPIN